MLLKKELKYYLSGPLPKDKKENNDWGFWNV